MRNNNLSRIPNNYEPHSETDPETVLKLLSTFGERNIDNRSIWNVGISIFSEKLVGHNTINENNKDNESNILRTHCS